MGSRLCMTHHAGVLPPPRGPGKDPDQGVKGLTAETFPELALSGCQALQALSLRRPCPWGSREGLRAQDHLPCPSLQVPPLLPRGTGSGPS